MGNDNLLDQITKALLLLQDDITQLKQDIRDIRKELLYLKEMLESLKND